MRRVRRTGRQMGGARGGGGATFGRRDRRRRRAHSVVQAGVGLGEEPKAHSYPSRASTQRHRKGTAPRGTRPRDGSAYDPAAMTGVSILGIGMTPLGKFPESSVKDLTQAAVTTALSDAGVELSDIEA